jgi:hypothetical protein
MEKIKQSKYKIIEKQNQIGRTKTLTALHFTVCVHFQSANSLLSHTAQLGNTFNIGRVLTALSLG